jgi:SOS-response transcriptional repressor LexA
VVGDYVVAKDTGEQRATFKRLTQDGDRHYLTPINRQYQAIHIDNGHIRIIGRVVLHQPKARKL